MKTFSLFTLLLFCCPIAFAQLTDDQKKKYDDSVKLQRRPAFEAMQPMNMEFTGTIYFDDYDPESGLLIFGDHMDKGLFSINEGKFIANYARTATREGLTVRTQKDYGNYRIAPGGNLIAQRIGSSTELFSRTAFIRSIPNAGILAFVTEKKAIAVDSKGKAGLFDLDQNKFLFMYGSYDEESAYNLSLNRTKLILYKHKRGKDDELYDVNTGRMIRKIKVYSFPSVTDRYVVYNKTGLRLEDVNTGKPVEPTGWVNDPSYRSSRVIGSALVVHNFGTGQIRVFDLDALQFTSTRGWRLFESELFKGAGYFPSQKKLFIVNTSPGGGSPFGLGIEGLPSATAYTLDVTTGEVTPYRYFRILRPEEIKPMTYNTSPEDLCLMGLKNRPNGASEKNFGMTGVIFQVLSYDCNRGVFTIQHRSVTAETITIFTSEIFKGEMEDQYHPIKVQLCSKCDGHGAYTKTVNYNVSTVDNYNAHVPGGKVITTKSGSFQQGTVCPVCKGQGYVKN